MTRFNKSAMRKAARIAPLTLAAVLLTACGGDGNGGMDDDVMMPSPSPTPSPTASPTPTGFDVTACLTQEVAPGVSVANLVVPDTLTLNLAASSGFPNGRQLPDPVIDVTLAVIFLDLGVHSPITLASVPVNPPENDVPYRPVFPYLAPAQGSPPLAAGGATSFDFRGDAPSAYVRVDRMGMPAVATALIGSDQKTAYNDADPADDANGDFVPELTEELTGLTNALGDDLVALGLTPCAMPAG